MIFWKTIKDIIAYYTVVMDTQNTKNVMCLCIPFIKAVGRHWNESVTEHQIHKNQIHKNPMVFSVVIFIFEFER